MQQFGIHVVLIEPGAIETEFGQVLVQGLEAQNGTGAYREMVQKVASATERSHASGTLSPPQVIVELLLKAVRSRRPRTRYTAGKYARPMMFIRKWLGDRIYDKMVLSIVR